MSPKPSGVSDKLTIQKLESPSVRVMSLPQAELKRLVKEVILKLPQAAGFKLIEPSDAHPDDGIHFSVDLNDAGSVLRGRAPELMYLWFDNPYSKKKDSVLSEDTRARVLAFRDALRTNEELLKAFLFIRSNVIYTGYSLDDEYEPRRFAFTFEYYPEAQRTLDLSLAQDDERNRIGVLRNEIARILREAPDVQETIKQIIKEKK